jgi:DnaJ-domain-containing protein 1
MPRIFLKPNSPEFADRKAKELAKRHCDMPGCAAQGDHRAPKDRALSDYYWFCQEHAREYNQAWNFFAGMSDREVNDHMMKSFYGDRPTWRYDMPGSAEEALRRNAWQTYNYTEKEPPKDGAKKPQGGNTPESEALVIMGLQPPITLDEIKARYKELVKKHHPDLNRGNLESEELLKSINMAYTILKLAYEQFKILPDRN